MFFFIYILSTGSVFSSNRILQYNSIEQLIHGCVMFWMSNDYHVWVGFLSRDFLIIVVPFG